MPGRIRDLWEKTKAKLPGGKKKAAAKASTTSSNKTSTNHTKVTSHAPNEVKKESATTTKSTAPPPKTDNVPTGATQKEKGLASEKTAATSQRKTSEEEEKLQTKRDKEPLKKEGPEVLDSTQRYPKYTMPPESEGTTNVVREPEVRESKRLPEVVQEKIYPQERVEIQPVIHREKEQTEIHKIVQPIVIKEVLPIERWRISDLPEFRQMPSTQPTTTTSVGGAEYVNRLPNLQSGTEMRGGVQVEKIMNTPIVHETVRTEYISAQTGEKIQPENLMGGQKATPTTSIDSSTRV
jgi:hypothetical protein